MKNNYYEHRATLESNKRPYKLRLYGDGGGTNGH